MNTCCSFVGVACPWTNNDEQVACLSGYYSVGLQKSCTRCPAGKQCPNIDAAPESGTDDCSDGYYR